MQPLRHARVQHDPETGLRDFAIETNVWSEALQNATVMLKHIKQSKAVTSCVLDSNWVIGCDEEYFGPIRSAAVIQNATWQAKSVVICSSLFVFRCHNSVKRNSQRWNETRRPHLAHTPHGTTRIGLLGLLKSSWISLFIWICTKHEWGLSWAGTHPPSKFRGNLLGSFGVILLKNQQMTAEVIRSLGYMY